MRRRLPNLLTLLSLLLCLAAVAGAIRSRGTEDSITNAAFTQGPLGEMTCREWNVTSVGGALILRRQTYLWLGPTGFKPGSTWEWESTATTARLGRLFSYEFWPDNMGAPDHFQARGIAFPYWLPAGRFAVLPGARLCRWLRPKYPAGHCRRCGYDLRATPGRCPECGTMPSAPPG